MDIKFLTILPTRSELILKNGTAFPSGYFMSEAYIPMYHWQHAGIEVAVATCGGKRPHLDDQSIVYMSKVKLKDAEAYFATTPNLQKPQKLEKLTEKELADYDALFIPGSYAIVQELMDSPHFKKILTYFHQEKKIIILMSQSTYLLSLLENVFKEEGTFPQITCFPEDRERSLEAVVFKDTLPFYLESRLKDMGFDINNNPSPLRPNVILNKHIITGQDFYSAGSISRLCLKIFNSKSGLLKTR